MTDKLIVVFGATGRQGGSVVRFLQQKGGFRIRGVTRDSNSEAAKKLAASGVEVVQANQWNADEVQKAVDGAYGAFVLTDFWKPDTMGKEQEVSKIVIDACKKAGVQHVVYSDLENTEKLSGGKFKVPHFTHKALAADYAEAQDFKYFTRVRPPFYYQNFQSFFPPKKEDDGTLVFTLPLTEKAYITSFDVDDYGEAVANVFANPEKYNHVIVNMGVEHLHPQEYVEIFAKVTGQKAKYNSISRETYAGFGFPGAEELADMFGWFEEYTYFGPDADPKKYQKELYPNAISFEDWLKKTGWKG